MLYIGSKNAVRCTKYHMKDTHTHNVWAKCKVVRLQNGGIHVARLRLYLVNVRSHIHTQHTDVTHKYKRLYFDKHNNFYIVQSYISLHVSA